MDNPRTIGVLVEEMTTVLASALGSDARAEARELVALQFDMPRHWPTTARDTDVSAEACDRAVGAARRRANGAPLQYAAGRAAFRHLTLCVDERVLIPRPETEQLVDIVLERTRTERGGVAVDVGTGSGAIALSLASEGRFTKVIGTDVSLDALAVARNNAKQGAGRWCAEVEMRQGSLLGPVPERGLRAVVSNPPYISFEEAATLPASVRNWEPPVALFSGDNGMATTVKLVGEAAGALAPSGLLAMEVDVRRAAMVAAATEAHGSYEDIRILLDLTGRERFVVARRREE
ncbi:MAG: peptide chain release factor N(5)-glutamine methyltransferase [bacterium]